MVRSLIFVLCLPAFLPAQEPKAIIERALQVSDRNSELSRNYTFLERQETRQLDGSGQVKDRKVETWDVTLLEGSPYRRLVARNDQPLSPKDQQKEEEKLRKSIEDRRKETDEQRQKRIAEWKRRQDERQRDPIRELSDAFDFRMAGEETLNDHDVWVIDATPHPGYKGKTSLARSMFPKIACRFWIDKSEYQAIRIEIRTLSAISMGVVLVRLSKGSRIAIDLTRVNGEVWLPKHIDVTAAARIFLVKGMNIEMSVDYSDYKKFQADSRILSIEGPTEP